MLLLKCLLFVSFCFAVTGAHSIQRRSLDLFRQMIDRVTHRDAFDFNSYGKYCGLQGSGRPMDSIDRCCKEHSKCYRHIIRHECRAWEKTGPYLTNYHWEEDEENKVKCTDMDGGCHRASCECDRNATLCIVSHISSYNKNHRKFFGIKLNHIFGIKKKLIRFHYDDDDDYDDDLYQKKANAIQHYFV